MMVSAECWVLGPASAPSTQTETRTAPRPSHQHPAPRLQHQALSTQLMNPVSTHVSTQHLAPSTRHS